MKSTYPSRVEPAVVVFVVVVLAISNILANRVLPAWSYVPWNLLVAALVVVVGLRLMPAEQLGLAHWRAGALWGAAVSGAVIAGYLLAVALPATRDLFDDRRVDGGWEFLAYHALVRIPLGTVLLEELAFRSVLPALLASRVRDTTTGVLAASLLFGLWHVLPAWQLRDVNPVLGDVFGGGGLGQAAAVLLAVLGTFAAGVGLCLLRYRSGSVLTPILVHATTNSAGYTLAWWLGG